ncbi:MAG: HNH endonuclease [Gemmataceae bacterium]|nr:HNH endonuclease [Gemmataceae bacterium]
MRPYPKLWGFSVTSICYRLGQLGWNTASAQRALEAILGCKIETSTIRTGVSDGDNPKYELGRAANLTEEQITELERYRDGTLKAHDFPEEVFESERFVEGATRTITVNAYERDPEARRKCIAAHGTVCSVCTMNFGKVYGPVAEGLIHVHHLRPLSEVKAAHTVDPVKDLRPVCPNCHAVLHWRVPAFSIEEVRAFLEKMKE